jgi:cardiolipin synthase
MPTPLSPAATETSVADATSAAPVAAPRVDAASAGELAYPTVAERAFARATGAEPIIGNAVRLLLDAQQNYPAWLDAIRAARHSILFESYIFDDDDVGHEFADALAAKAREGVAVRVTCDWLGTRRLGWIRKRLADSGAELRIFNPPRFDSPLGWLARDHRKTIAVDGRVGFVSGLCVSSKWEGDPARGMEPWRDTGIELRGPAVAELTRAFADVWHACGGTTLPLGPFAAEGGVPSEGDVSVRVVAGTPSGAGTYRLDLVIASLARRQLWLTDAYFVGTAAYVQALAAAARDGVDVRLLVPGASDIPALRPLSRASYRALLAAGVRVFEWDGTMLHAKTAVADGLWSRVGSTNLNIASWMENYELDVAIEDRRFGAAMAEQYEIDLTHATEIVLTSHHRVRLAQDRTASAVRRARSGSAGRVAAGAVSVGSALGAALTNRRALDAAESGLLTKVSIAALAFALVAALWPQAIAWPLAVVAAWVGIAWVIKAVAVRHRARTREATPLADVVEAERGGGEGE